MGRGLGASVGFARIEQQLGLQELGSAMSTPRGPREVTPRDPREITPRGTREVTPRGTREVTPRGTREAEIHPVSVGAGASTATLSNLPPPELVRLDQAEEAFDRLSEAFPLAGQDEGDELWRWIENVMIEVQGAESSHMEVRTQG